MNPEEKKRYDREFLLGFQFIFASMQKPEGLPQITDVVLDKVGAVLGRGVLGAGGGSGRAGLGRDPRLCPGHCSGGSFSSSLSRR